MSTQQKLKLEQAITGDVSDDEKDTFITDKDTKNFKRIKQKMREFSTSLKTWKIEWIEEKVTLSINTCACGKTGLKYRYQIINKYTKKQLIIGSVCVRSFYKMIQEQKGCSKLKKMFENMVQSDRNRIRYNKVKKDIEEGTTQMFIINPKIYKTKRPNVYSCEVIGKRSLRYLHTLFEMKFRYPCGYISKTDKTYLTMYSTTDISTLDDIHVNVKITCNKGLYVNARFLECY